MIFLLKVTLFTHNGTPLLSWHSLSLQHQVIFNLCISSITISSECNMSLCVEYVYIEDSRQGLFHVSEIPCELSGTMAMVLAAWSRMWLHKVCFDDFFLWSSGLMHTVSYLVKVQTSFAGALLCLTLRPASFIHIKPHVLVTFVPGRECASANRSSS